MGLLSADALNSALEKLRVTNLNDVATSIGKLTGDALVGMHDMLTRVAIDQSETGGLTVKKMLKREHGAVIDEDKAAETGPGGESGNVEK